MDNVATLTSGNTATSTNVFTGLTYLPDTDTPATTDVFADLTYADTTTPTQPGE